FIHQSVKDYFITKGLAALGRSPTSTNSTVGTIHCALARTCVRYLTMEEIGQSTSYDRDHFPFSHYATTSWVAHMKQCDVIDQDFLELCDWLSNDLVEVWTRIYRSYDRYSDNCPADGMGILHVFSRYGLLESLKVI